MKFNVIPVSLIVMFILVLVSNIFWSIQMYSAGHNFLGFVNSLVAVMMIIAAIHRTKWTKEIKMTESFIAFIIVCVLCLASMFAGYSMASSMASSDLKKMNTSISNLRELKKECELHLPRTQQCKITFTGDL